MISLNSNDHTSFLFQCPGNCMTCAWATHQYVEGKHTSTFCGLPRDTGGGWFQVPIETGYNHDQYSTIIRAIETLLYQYIKVYPEDITIQGLAELIYGKISEMIKNEQS